MRNTKQNIKINQKGSGGYDKSCAIKIPIKSPIEEKFSLYPFSLAKESILLKSEIKKNILKIVLAAGIMFKFSFC